MPHSKYKKIEKQLQIELLKLQNHVKEKSLKVLFIFEGRDAAGKSGAIRRITRHLNPRGARIVALDKPSNIEKTQWYFQRYIQHLPNAGEMVFFDRSWYNRATVEPVMGFCTKKEHEVFLNHVNDFEKMLVDSGIRIFKFYFSISKLEQQKRFLERSTNPLKQYKVSPVDEKAQELWDEYTKAKYEMLRSSYTEAAPWSVIRSDHKKKARAACMGHILESFQYPNKIDPASIYDSSKILVDAKEEINSFYK